MIKLTNDEIEVMGTPCFASAHYAKMLIRHGLYEDKAKKAEYEQAVFTHWALGLLKEHGSNWKVEGNKILSAIQVHKND